MQLLHVRFCRLFLFLFYNKWVNVDKNIVDIFQHHNMMM